MDPDQYLKEDIVMYNSNTGGIVLYGPRYRSEQLAAEDAEANPGLIFFIYLPLEN